MGTVKARIAGVGYTWPSSFKPPAQLNTLVFCGGIHDKIVFKSLPTEMGAECVSSAIAQALLITATQWLYFCAHVAAIITRNG